MRRIIPKDHIQKKHEIEEEDKRAVYGTAASRAGLERPGNAFLVGLRGSGKTTVGRLAAERMGRQFVDMDDEIENRAGKSIAEMVAASGWEAFRDLESEVLADLCGQDGLVVATGGGVIERAMNRRLLNASGTCVYLMASVPELAARLGADPDEDKRPSLTGASVTEELAETMIRREPLYMEVADHILQASGKPEDLAEALAEKIPS